MDKQLQYAWAAGIIDGEGCIHIRLNRATDKTRHASDSYALVVKVTMCHEETVHRLRSIFNLGTTLKTIEESASRSAAYTWKCSSTHAALVLSYVRPFLVTKAVEADCALRFASLPPGRQGRRPVDTELLQQRRFLYTELRELKSRARFYPVSS